MTTKLQALLAAILTGFIGFVNWLATVPPEQQAGMLAALVEIIPLDWRPTVGLISRLLMFASGIFATYKASQSAPHVPLTKPPTPAEEDRSRGQARLFMLLPLCALLVGCETPFSASLAYSPDGKQSVSGTVFFGGIPRRDDSKTVKPPQQQP